MAGKKTYMGLTSLVMALLLAFSPAASTVSYAADRINMSYIYFGDSNAYYQHVKTTKNSLDEISPNYFIISDEGDLAFTPAVDESFVRQMHQEGVKVVPFLSNHWDRAKGIKALQNRREFTDQLARAVKEYELDGVDVDIENVTEAEKDMYTDFVRLLRSKLPADKVISVAVAPNPYDITKGWQASYDYHELAKYSDYLMIMAYDESYTGGPAGPVASYGFVENTIRKALTQVSKDKIVLGIPFYGRYWKNGASKGGYGLSNTEVEKLIRDYRGKVTFDEAAKSPKAVITIRSTDAKPVVLGKQLDAGTYTIWFENEMSIKYKLELVNKYDLKGTGSWSLGQETPETWNYYNMWLDGHFFADSEGHWAQASIISMAEKGWMNGVSGNAFAPDNPLTRAEAAAILVRALALTEKTGADVEFNDISGHWAEKEILTAAQNGIVLGTGDGKFSPDKPLSRQEMAVMLDRILTVAGNGSGSGIPFRDISSSSNPWSYASIVRLANIGIFTGNPDGTFGPENNTTRAQMAVLMDRISGYISDGRVIAFR